MGPIGAAGEFLLYFLAFFLKEIALFWPFWIKCPNKGQFFTKLGPQKKDKSSKKKDEWEPWSKILFSLSDFTCLAQIGPPENAWEESALGAKQNAPNCAPFQPWPNGVCRRKRFYKRVQGTVRDNHEINLDFLYFFRNKMRKKHIPLKFWLKFKWRTQKKE